MPLLKVPSRNRRRSQSKEPCRILRSGPYETSRRVRPMFVVVGETREVAASIEGCHVPCLRGQNVGFQRCRVRNMSMTKAT